MSNHLAIATVTATLRQRLHNVVTQEVSGSSVEILPPNDSKLKDTQPTLNVYLYHLTPNAAWANEELPVRRENGTVVTRPQLALRLHYILTAFGRATQSDPEAHRLLGSAIRTLHERPILTRTEIASVVQSHTELSGSNLSDQVELVRITPQSLSIEELSKLWSVFFQTPYRISATYEASVVLLDGESLAQPSLPVQARNFYVVTLRAPVIEAVEAAAGRHVPIRAEAEVVIRGTNLRGEPTRLRFGTAELTIDADHAFDDRIEATLPSSLRAGVQGVQVVHPRMMGTPETEHGGSASNLAAFVLRPRIQRNAADTAWEIAVNVTSGAGTDPRGGEMTVRLEPDVARAQRVVLILNEFDAPAARSPLSHSFEAPSRADDPAETTDTIEFVFAGVAAATYLVRVQVDGAESPLELDGTGRYAEPAVVVP